MAALSFKITFLSVLQILFLASVGYALLKKSVLDDGSLQFLTKLVINIILPCFMFSHLMNHFRFEAYPQWWIFPIISIGITTTAFFFSRILVLRSQDKLFKDQFSLLLSFQNSGYIPMLVVISLFTGEQANTLLIYVFLYLIGFDLMLWTLGVWLLNQEKTSSVDFKRLINPPFMTMLGTLGLMFFGLHNWFPRTILNPIKLLGDCTLPLSMIIVGGNLAKTQLLSVDLKKVSGYVLAKLVLFPLIAFTVILLLEIDYLLGFLIMIECATPSAVSLSVMARYFQVNDTFINQALLVGHLVSVISLPLFLTLYSMYY